MIIYTFVLIVMNIDINSCKNIISTSEVFVSDAVGKSSQLFGAALGVIKSKGGQR